MDWRTIVAHEYKGAGTAEDPHVVVWLPHDTENPYRWNPVYKWTLTVLGESSSKTRARHAARGTRHGHRSRPSVVVRVQR